jgi:dTDP-4-amino-4,6-dideoxygalactose transaminase
MPEPSKDYSNRWLSVFVINPSKTNITNNKLIELLSELNIEARHVWKPMHQQPVLMVCNILWQVKKVIVIICSIMACAYHLLQI